MVLGRASGAWGVPWDARISRRHVELHWNGERLEARQVTDSRNPIFFLGSKQAEFSVRVGQHFVIGGTTFTLTDERVNLTVALPRPDNEQTFSAEFLQSIRFRHADQRIDVLSRLPNMISGAGNDNELFVRLVNLVLAGVPRATAAALVAVRLTADRDPIRILHWDRRLVVGDEFTPSATLMRRAVDSGESVVHVWTSAAGSAAVTHSEHFDWAFCTPLTSEACRGWAIYVAGSFSAADRQSSTDPRDFQDDVKFTELVATTLGSLRQVRRAERMNQFFSPAVVDAVAGQDPDEVLAPRETEVAVMFCDLRGFSRRSERQADDLLGLLNRVSDALGVMTHEILEEGGVVGDFHGDAAMGFWGWPIPQHDAIQRACRAALAIRRKFAESAQREDHPLADFRVGIGVATGRAVAGKIGTVDQVKVTVFGPVVNLASRLESMTKTLRAAILVDETTAAGVRAGLPRDVARVRRVAAVKPPGLDGALEVSELLPPENEYPQLTDEHIIAYEEALNSLLAGDWVRAFQMLHHVPADDRVKDFLTVFIAQHNRTPPANWDGVIPL